MELPNYFPEYGLTPTLPFRSILQIVNGLSGKIQDLTLPPGFKLPPERELARLLGVSRTTAINAYSLLEERGIGIFACRQRHLCHNERIHLR